MTTTTQPTRQTIAGIWSELQRLNVPMRGWWYDPEGEDSQDSEPAYGMEVAPEALAGWDIDGLIFEWDAVHGWTMHDWCTPQILREGVLVLDIPDPFDVPAVAEHLRKVIVGEIDEFRRVPA